MVYKMLLIRLWIIYFTSALTQYWYHVSGDNVHNIMFYCIVLLPDNVLFDMNIWFMISIGLLSYSSRGIMFYAMCLLSPMTCIIKKRLTSKQNGSISCMAWYLKHDKEMTGLTCLRIIFSMMIIWNIVHLNVSDETSDPISLCWIGWYGLERKCLKLGK